MKSPGWPKQGEPLSAIWTRDMGNAHRSGTIRSSSKVRVNAGPGGTTITPILDRKPVRRVFVPYKPWQIQITMPSGDSTTGTASIAPGTVNGVCPTLGSGGYLWSQPAPTVSVSIDPTAPTTCTGFYIKLTSAAGVLSACEIDTTTFNSSSTSTFVPTDSTTVSYKALGYVDGTGAVTQLVTTNLSYFQGCKFWAADAEAVEHVWQTA